MQSLGFARRLLRLGLLRRRRLLLLLDLLSPWNRACKHQRQSDADE
jgi:hypothetical protein